MRMTSDQVQALVGLWLLRLTAGDPDIECVYCGKLKEDSNGH